MNEKIFDSLKTYKYIYYFLASGDKSKDELRDFIVANGKSDTTIKAHTSKAVSGELPYIMCKGEIVTLDKSSITDFFKELAAGFQYEVQLEPKGTKKKKPEDEIAKVTESHSKGYKEMQKQVSSVKAMEKSYQEQLKERDAIIAELNNQIASKVENAILEVMDSKVLLVGTVSSKPAEKFKRDFFLDSPERLLDVDDLVSRYGGVIDSPYEPILAAEKELTTPNYLKRMAKLLFGGKFLKERLEEQEAYPHVVRAANWINESKITPAQIEQNRLNSINELLKTEGISNQAKLSLYAAWFTGLDSELVELLEYAGQQDINANYVIRLFEKPKEYYNYRTIREMLKQAKKPSEAHIKRQAAVELISGEWYVEAEYGGKMCKFQMMPVDELEHFKELLRKHQ